MGEIIAGAMMVFNLMTILWIIFGVILGIILGAIPGLTATMGIALMLPLAIRLDTATGMALLLAVYSGAIIGASIPAILLGIPGNPNAIATIYDGFPLTKKGRAAEALGGAVAASFIGGIGSLIILVLFAPLIARFTLLFGPPERAALAVVGLTIIASVSSKHIAKGLLMGGFGLALALTGPDNITQTMRMPFPEYTMGTPLSGGIKLIPALIGLFGISQAIYDIEQISKGKLTPTQVTGKRLLPKPKFLLKRWRILLESTGIGTLIGAIPGAGASIAVFLSYQRAQTITSTSKKLKPEVPLGEGAIEGVIAPEVANNACKGGALIPALSLGIPGDAGTAVLLGALLIKGVVPGHQLFTQDIDLVYAIFIAIFLANVLMVVFQLAGIKIFPKILSLRTAYLLPLILIFSMIGAYSIEGRAITAASFNMGVALVLGILGYFLKKNQYPIAPIVLGLILGDILEQNFRRAVRLAQGDYLVFFQRPIALVFILLALFSIGFSIWNTNKSNAASDSKKGTNG